MDTKLPARPNLEHLRSQAKALLAGLKNGDPEAAKAFIQHLPAAANMVPEQVRNAGFRLADAQSAIARKNGFASWPGLARYVEQLRALEGAWEFIDLEVDGTAMPAIGAALLIDGDRFRMESPEATYEGVFSIDVECEPHRIDIEFVEGPEAGNWSYGIYNLEGDRLTICLGLTGAERPADFATSPGRGHALEHLRRTSKARPANVGGGNPPPKVEQAPVDETAFELAMTPLLERLQGEWAPTMRVMNGAPVPMLEYGARSMSGNETKVVFGGQTMLHAKVRMDESAAPITIDYLHLSGGAKGKVTFGILDWVGGEIRICMAPPGAPRPTDFTCDKGSNRTLSQWRKR